jgi:major vault protein
VDVVFEELEIRTAEEYNEPFPLYPYEELYQDISPFTYLNDKEALILRADMQFKDDRSKGTIRYVNDEYYFKGPGTYIPRIQESVMRKVEA